MNVSIALLYLSCLSILNGCASGPKVGSLEYIDKQVYQCRELCNNATVDLARIEGLHCLCNKPEKAPFIYNPIVTGASNGTPILAQPVTVSSITPQQASTQRTVDLEPKANASIIQDASGKTIFSQVK